MTPAGPTRRFSDLAGNGRKRRTRMKRGRQISHLRLSSQRARAALGQRGPRALLETERRLSSLTRTIHPGELRAMRWVLLVLFVLLAGCGGGRAPTPPPRPPTVLPPCLMGLARAGVRQRRLPAPHFSRRRQTNGS